MQRQHRSFSKYDDLGAYHWASCERRSRSYEPATEARYTALVKRMGGATRILDVGCGDGYLMHLASQRCETVVGVDTDRTGVQIGARLLDDHVTCILGLASCYALPFANESFDIVVLADIIEHLDNPERCLAETRRVLVADGRSLVTTPKWLPGRMWDPEHHWKEYKPEELVELLERYFASVTLSFFISAAWWKVRRRLGKGFMRSFARHLYNPFIRENAEPEKSCHILAVCEQPLS
ncbi:MAG: class I SAM-dependent methyltransferase [Gemmatimonadota bacterium]|nr:MAG: class I SAM-dependent methyltransferase [Gemmatimonadota bacterium]